MLQIHSLGQRGEEAKIGEKNRPVMKGQAALERHRCVGVYKAGAARAQCTF